MKRLSILFRMRRGFIHIADNPHISKVLRSLTQILCIPGLRLGYLVNSNDAAVARMRRQQMPWSVSSALAALAGEVALRDGGGRLAWLREEGARFYQALSAPADGLSGGANYLLLRFVSGY